MVSDRTRDLLFPITILISVAVGAVIGGSFTRSGTDSRQPISATSADSKTLVDAIDAMRVEFVRTREQFAMTSSSAPSSALAETRSVAPDMTSELRKATAQLTEAADSLRTAASHAGGDRPPLIAPATVDPKALQVVQNQTWDVNRKTYLLLTYQQVMDRFGPPDYVDTRDNKIIWRYNAKPESVSFHFADGRVCGLGN